MSIEKRKEAYEFGRIAEEKVVEEYLKKGYSILERNWRIGKTEIDIIAQKEDRIILVEVKARNTNEEDALAAVDRDKRKRMIKAADVYLRRMDGIFNYRFDIAICLGTISQHELEIIEDAFVSADLF